MKCINCGGEVSEFEAKWGFEDCSKCDPTNQDDFLEGKTCNPDAPEECESCQ